MTKSERQVIIFVIAIIFAFMFLAFWQWGIDDQIGMAEKIYQNGTADLKATHSDEGFYFLNINGRWERAQVCFSTPAATIPMGKAPKGIFIPIVRIPGHRK